MQPAIDDFVKRTQEIELYFSFLDKLDKDNPTLTYEEVNVNHSVDIDPDLLRILKANGFILLYNLIEASFKNSLYEILQAVQNDILPYKHLTEEIKVYWLSQKIHQFKDSNHSTLTGIFKDIADNVLNEVGVSFDKKFIIKQISGNIDARKIRELSQSYGFQSSVTNESQGDSLLDIKDKRNSLAHGDLTFVECGKGYSVPQMINFKKDVIEYMRDILSNVEKFVNSQSYYLP